MNLKKLQLVLVTALFTALMTWPAYGGRFSGKSQSGGRSQVGPARNSSKADVGRSHAMTSRPQAQVSRSQPARSSSFSSGRSHASVESRSMRSSGSSVHRSSPGRSERSATVSRSTRSYRDSGPATSHRSPGRSGGGRGDRSYSSKSSTRVHVDVNVGGRGYSRHRYDRYYDRHHDGWFGSFGLDYGYHRPWRYYRPYNRVYCWWPRYTTVYVYGSIPSVIVERPVVEDTDVVVIDSPRVYETDQQKYIDQVLHSESDQRIEAAQKLSEFNTMESTAALVDVMINDADGRVRHAAAVSLGEMLQPSAYEALVRSEHYEQDDQAKIAAQDAIKQLEGKYSEDHLYVSPKMRPMNTGNEKLGEFLEDLRYGNWKTRKEAADHLDDEKGTQAAAALINVMLNDSMSDVRKQAAESLGKIGDRMALPFLLWTRENDQDKSVRKEADKALDKVRDTIM